jgi:S-adenosylmethionine synthetase
MNPNVILRAAEWVLPGHPDKLADAVADALVQAAQLRQPEALCAIEVAVHRDQVYLTGRLACEGADRLPLRELVQGVYQSAGYGAGCGSDHGPWRPAPHEIGVGGNLCLEPLVPGEERIRHISDDQSIVTGYAVDLPGVGCIPPEQWLAREVARRLFALVRSPLALCPDGKVLVVLEEEVSAAGAPSAWRLHAVSCSLLAQAGDVALHRAAAQAVREAACELARRLPGFEAGQGRDVPAAREPAKPYELVVNGSGTFSIGGPEGDNGLSGKKLLLDHYGPRVPVGGTALSGKDFWKPDRAGTLLARRVALAVVRAGVAREATVQWIAFPGDEAPRLVRITTEKGELPEASRWLRLLDCRFETASGWGRGVDLVERARWGWFGVGEAAVDEGGLAWEAQRLK